MSAKTARIAVALVIIVAAWAGLGAIATTLLLGANTQDNSADTHPVSKSPSPGSPAALVEQHDCWVGAAPANQEGKTPGGVVLSLPGKDARYVADPSVVDAALEHVLGDEREGWRVHAFCP